MKSYVWPQLILQHLTIQHGWCREILDLPELSHESMTAIPARALQFEMAQRLLPKEFNDLWKCTDVNGIPDEQFVRWMVANGMNSCLTIALCVVGVSLTSSFNSKKPWRTR